MRDDTIDEAKVDIAGQLGVAPADVLYGFEECAHKAGIGERQFRDRWQHPERLDVSSGGYWSAYDYKTGDIQLVPERDADGRIPRRFKPFTTVTTGTSNVALFRERLGPVRSDAGLKGGKESQRIPRRIGDTIKYDE